MLSRTNTNSKAPSSQLNSVIDIAPGASPITPGTAPTTRPVSRVTVIPSSEPRTAMPIVRRVLPGATRTPYLSRVSTRLTVAGPTDKTHPSFGPHHKTVSGGRDKRSEDAAILERPLDDA